MMMGDGKMILVTKLSSPGFSRPVVDTLTAVAVLESNCCYECINFKEYYFGDEEYIGASFYDVKTTEEKLEHLLDSQCGAEFMVETVEENCNVIKSEIPFVGTILASNRTDDSFVNKDSC